MLHRRSISKSAMWPMISSRTSWGRKRRRAPDLGKLRAIVSARAFLFAVNELFLCREWVVILGS
ncbi:hypothetical protein BDV98DRAFT_574586 [Pterulicium gracile]|uniref:Uncharacterized protein n=1 Tax=Pterulicium gracile TaxID=1884261 RepID=A0A5C3Q7F7_9AGAR|nr:hypothetical protein BDV98DRAFT_574586 [Pterula gracilis]